MDNRAVTAARFIEKWIKDLNHHKTLVDYDASKYIIPFLEDRGLYMEIPFRNKVVLGHSLTDELGTTTMINQNIATLERKLFTQAHELGHHILDPELLKHNSEINILTDDPIELNKSAEVRANTFAAHLLLPDDVLNALMLEKIAKKRIKMRQHVSYETLGYRLISFMTGIYHLPQKLSEEMVNEFMDYDSNNSLYDFWQQANIKKPINDQRTLRTINEEIALYHHDYELYNHRLRKKRQIRKNENVLIADQDKLLYFALAENGSCLYDDELPF
ncbi:ImmA/IrrE family metallo-endopeptidase [Enterococcus hulanensis]|uniref:ImmA/IrrE family metallo-endopeptidase n=1 Tax=Enterococcus TaxID=1350 RepID=UPI000B5A70AC|nr:MULTISPECIES: ImmA/IrrE family metallo-endopeptidase [Enterococcus]MBO0412457.1 ImmA/IrrE family metallo-endopeptidase [Enterococcus hulanensis]OTO15159.1 hypothetical protein A5875_004316 [Enterococcus sp. 3H8_DIV0648]